MRIKENWICRIAAVFSGCLLLIFVSGCGSDETAQIQRCGAGTALVDGECVLDSDGCGPNTVLEDGMCVVADEVCGEGTTLDQATRECVAESMVTCGEGTILDGEKCVPDSELCSNGLVWDEDQQRCRLSEANCGPGTQLSTDGLCVVVEDEFCGDKTVFDTDLEVCVPTEDMCMGSTVFNEEVGGCVAGHLITGDCDSPTVIDDDITESTVLPRGNCYEVTDFIDIRSSNGETALTIEPGVRIGFHAGAGMVVVGDNGVLSAQGEEEEPIVFTGTVAEPGHWLGILFRDSDNSLNRLVHTVVEYAGSTTLPDVPVRAGVAIGDTFSTSSYSRRSTAKIEQTTIRHSAGYGLFIGDRMTPERLRDFAENRYTDNVEGSVYAPASMAHRLGEDSVHTGNDRDAIELYSGDITTAATWPNFDVPYYVSSGFSISEDGRLTIEPGTTLEMGSDADITVRDDTAALIAEGTDDEVITFTGAEPQQGYWQGIFFRDSDNEANRLVHAVVEYAGSTTLPDVPVRSAVAIGDNWSTSSYSRRSTAKIQQTTIRQSGGYGLFTGDRMTSERLRDFEANIITENAEGPVWIRASLVGELGADSEMTGNERDIFDIYDTDISSGTPTWYDYGVPYRAHSGIRVLDEARLSLEPGVTIEFEEAEGLRIEGALIAQGSADAPVILTGAVDLPGFWRGVYFDGTDSILNKLEQVEISYGGFPAWIDDRGANLTLEESGISLDGVDLYDGVEAGVHITGSTLRSCTDVFFDGNDVEVTGDVAGWEDECGML